MKDRNDELINGRFAETEFPEDEFSADASTEDMSGEGDSAEFEYIEDFDISEDAQTSETHTSVQPRRRKGTKTGSGSASGNGPRSAGGRTGSGSSSRNTGTASRSTATAKRKKKKKKKKQGINIHLVIGGAMLLILIAVLIRLYVWNMGTHSGYDPNEVTDEFDTEALDYIQPLDPELLEGREDDGVTTILALGNDPFSDERGENGIAELVADKLDATVLNGAFPGSTIATKNPEYQNSYPLDGLSLYWVVAALANQNFELMNKVTADMANESAIAAAETLNAVDMDKVDVITIMYDLQDYMGERIVYDNTNENNINSCCGALNASIQLIEETWPHIRIIVLSHPYGTFTAGDGTVVDGDRDDLGNGTLTDYMGWEIQICVSNGVTFIDNYYGTITVDDSHLLVDGFHLTQEGRQKVADRIVDVLDGNSEE